jgi:hypothetical protein
MKRGARGAIHRRDCFSMIARKRDQNLSKDRRPAGKPRISLLYVGGLRCQPFRRRVNGSNVKSQSESVHNGTDVCLLRVYHRVCKFLA